MYDGWRYRIQFFNVSPHHLSPGALWNHLLQMLAQPVVNGLMSLVNKSTPVSTPELWQYVSYTIDQQLLWWGKASSAIKLMMFSEIWTRDPKVTFLKGNTVRLRTLGVISCFISYRIIDICIKFLYPGGTFQFAGLPQFQNEVLPKRERDREGGDTEAFRQLIEGHFVLNCRQSY